MNIIIKTKNLELTESLEKFINVKMQTLKKFIGTVKEDLFDIFVEIEKETKHHKKGDIFKAEAMVYLYGKNLVAQAHGEDLSKAVTEVKKELEREIRKHKTKKIELPRRKSKKLS